MIPQLLSQNLYVWRLTKIFVRRKNNFWRRHYDSTTWTSYDVGSGSTLMASMIVSMIAQDTDHDDCHFRARFVRPSSQTFLIVHIRLFDNVSRHQQCPWNCLRCTEHWHDIFFTRLLSSTTGNVSTSYRTTCVDVRRLAALRLTTWNDVLDAAT